MHDHWEEHVDEGMLLQANLDDMSPELTSAITDWLFRAGVGQGRLLSGRARSICA
ncbi:LarC family nickel insertion protein [Paenibacillus puerhi]|uniref:LarC family nickel insertion protein n=1 Tax=Paenibacillus puerhi TaxID=2692622 RepID=UPI001F3E31DE|nr:LarC family nickel insertion protein [Paenibacillus puerhi]